MLRDHSSFKKNIFNMQPNKPKVGKILMVAHVIGHAIFVFILRLVAITGLGISFWGLWGKELMYI